MSAEPYAEFKARLQQFMQDRDWKQFHNPKDLAIAISLEASELLEHFLWKNGAEIGTRVDSHGDEIRDEAADIGIYLMELCDVLEKAGLKYPVEKARGSARKYTELRDE
jgi:dCTP diphosphatase